MYLNNIEEIDPKVFRGLHALKQLNISYNRLTTISDDLFHDLANLQFLNVSNNQLSKICTNQFKGKYTILRRHDHK